MMDAAAAEGQAEPPLPSAGGPAAAAMKSVGENNPSIPIAGSSDGDDAADSGNSNSNSISSNAPPLHNDYLHNMVLPPALLNLTAEQRKLLVLAALGVVLAFPGAMIRYLSSLLLRIGGTAVGIGLGLGLAAHIHDALDGMADRHWRDAARKRQVGQQQQQRTTSAVTGNNTPRAVDSQTTASASASASSRAVGGSSTTARSSSRRADLLDENSYHALMASAGYDVPDGLLRGQILRTTAGQSTTAVDAANADIIATTGTGAGTGAGTVGGGSEQKRPITAATILENTVADGPNKGRTPNPLYPASVPDAFSNFTSVPTPRGPSTLKRMYPTLPTNICHELGTFMDLIMRDFIHCWFCTIDPAVLYEDEKERRQRVQAERERQAKKAKMMEVIEEGRKAMAMAAAGAEAGAEAGGAGAGAGDSATTDAIADAIVGNAVVSGDARHSQEKSAQTSKHSLMVLSTAPLRPSPFPEALYATMATLFGSLAVNARDNVNIMELVLVKVVRVLSLNIKTYRELRKFAVNKHRRRLASARGRVKRVQQPSSTAARDVGGGAGAAELRSATSHDRLDTAARSADATSSVDVGLQRKSSRGSLTSPPGSGNGTFEGGLSPRERGQSFGASSTSGDNAALPSESEITEIAMIREYLLAGKLHRAITFGMDVPSLLFADPHGRDCPPPSMEEDDDSDGVGLPKDDGATSTATGGILEDDDVLYARLFAPKSQLMVESELDYCRILSHRLIKETTTKVDFDSSTLRSMAVEMVASCVLAPIMSCFSPDMINYGLIKVLEPYAQATSGNASTDGESEETKLTTTDSDMDLMRGWDQSSSGAELVPMEEGKELAHNVRTEFGELEEADDLSLVETFDDIDAGTISGDIDTNELTRDKSCQNILTLLTMSLIALQEHLNFEEIKLSRESNTEVTVNWDAPYCRAAVRRLVLVVEAALLHGLRTQHEREHSIRSEGGDRKEDFSNDNGINQNNVEGEGQLLDDDDVEDVELVEDAAHLHPTSIIVLLMELTENLDAFEKRVSEDEGMGSSASLGESEHSHDDANDVEMLKIDWTTTLPPNEISSLRTLIAAWLHTGQLFRTLSVFLQSRRTILRPFYHSFSFMRDADAAAGFVRQLKVLDGIDILVDTAAVLRCQSLDLRGDLQLESDDVVEEEIVHGIDGSAADSFFAADGLEPGNAPSSSGDAEHPTAVTSTHGIGVSLVGGVRANLRSNRQRLSRLVTTDLANVASTLTGSGSSHAAAAAATSSSSSGKSPPTTLAAAVAAIHMQHQRQNFDVPHLAFSRNAAFAENLRKERDRRMASWEKVAAASHQNVTVDMIVHTRGLTDRDVQIHRELHGLARAFYSGSVVLNISQNTLSNADGGDEGGRAPQISMENVANRRRFEVPDDDSSFLLRASSRRLTPLGVTRNARDHSQSYISFLATYQEPILHPKSKRFKGGRYIRQVEIKFFPSDKTATVSPRKDDAPRHMHANLKVKTLSSMGSGHSLSASKGGTRSSSSSFLSSNFQKTRHLCQRHMAAGSGNVLTASINPSLMDSDDFVATPRVGKAYDFVYRFHLFEKPVVDIGGKQFTVQDSSLKGVHKADASALEISDATLSYALLTLGESIVGDSDTLGPSDGVSIGELGDDDGHSSVSASKKNTIVGGISLQRGEEGSPTMILMKIKTSRGTGDTGNGTEKGAEASFVMRPFRPSFLRAALLQTSTRQEAQLQCLLTCVKAGSARNATRARTEALLQPYLTLLEFAVSKKREKQSILLRDLKLGINHIDVDQLRRNAILNPRYPTVLHSLSAVTVEGAIKAKASNDLIGSPAMVLYKIRVSAIVEEVIDNDDSSFYREDWVVLRPFRDFVTLHKYLKKTVNEKESSGNAGAKLVGAAAAALTFSTNQRQRPILIPSLGQAKELGALGVTQKSIEKRREILSQYLSYLTDPKHLLHTCPELMRFLGASDAFPEHIDANAGPDTLGRIHLKRTPLSREVVLDDMMRLGLGTSQVNIEGIMSENTDMASRSAAVAVSPRGMSSPRLVPNNGSTANLGDKRPARSGSRGKEQKKGNSLQRAKLASIRSQVEQVSLSEVRNGIFRFIRYLFDLDNASFFRSRILSTLKTISLAVTSAQEFHKLLFRMHLQHASAEAWAGWISFGREILWPEGVFFDSAPPQDPEELKEQEKQAKSLLLAMLPEQMRAVLSEDIAMDGIGILHEMLQNRVVLRSMSYMLMDEVYASIFPALNDVVTGCSAVDVQDGGP